MAEKQRLDKWLWFARVVKTRSLAAKLVADGHVRVNTQRIDMPAKTVGPGDVLTIALERRVAVLRIVGIGTRRGPFSEASLLFEDLNVARGTETKVASETASSLAHTTESESKN